MSSNDSYSETHLEHIQVNPSAPGGKGCCGPQLIRLMTWRQQLHIKMLPMSLQPEQKYLKFLTLCWGWTAGLLEFLVIAVTLWSFVLKVLPVKLSSYCCCEQLWGVDFLSAHIVRQRMSSAKVFVFDSFIIELSNSS